MPWLAVVLWLTCHLDADASGQGHEEPGALDLRREPWRASGMTQHRARYGPHNPEETYVMHAFPEQLADLGEVRMNYATAGDASSPESALCVRPCRRYRRRVPGRRGISVQYPIAPYRQGEPVGYEFCAGA